MSKDKTGKNKRIEVFFTFIQVVVIMVLVAISIATFGTRVPFLANLGFNFFAVTSGSMEPTIPTGSLILSGKYKIDGLKEGDVITYAKTNPETNERAVVTHRIDKLEKTETKKMVQGEDGKETEQASVEYTIHTKGDANAEADSYTVAIGEVIGVYKWHVPKLGYLTAFVQTPKGFVGLVIIPAAILVIWEVVSLIMHFKNEYKMKAESEVAHLKAELEKHKQHA